MYISQQKIGMEHIGGGNQQIGAMSCCGGGCTCKDNCWTAAGTFDMLLVWFIVGSFATGCSVSSCAALSLHFEHKQRSLMSLLGCSVLSQCKHSEKNISPASSNQTEDCILQFVQFD